LSPIGHTQVVLWTKNALMSDASSFVYDASDSNLLDEMGVSSSMVVRLSYKNIKIQHVVLNLFT